MGLEELRASDQASYHRHAGPVNPFHALDREWVEHSIPDRFRLQVARHPKRTALKTSTEELTYRALDELSNRIGNAILQYVDEREQAAGLLFQHDALVPAAILGALKAGKFYVSLDAAYPRDRNEFLLADTEARVIVTDNANLALAESLARSQTDQRIHVINIDALDARADDRDPHVESGPDRLVYLTYTSGSTGKPKGVVHTHRSVLHKVLRYTNGGHLNADDRIALLFKYTFGAAMSDLYSALLNGAALCPFDVTQESPAKLLEWLVRERITFFHTVPTFFRHFTSIRASETRFPTCG